MFPNNWIEHDKELISSTSLVIMFQDNLSPRLGAEPPIILSDFSNIENIVLKYGRADIKPVFSSYESFNQQHYQFHLHQYYKLEFNTTVDILALLNELKQIKEIQNVELNYNQSLHKSIYI